MNEMFAFAGSDYVNMPHSCLSLTMLWGTLG
jgi:hypothetical protein